MKHITVIDYGAGNLHSVCAGLNRVKAQADMVHVTADPDALARASHIVLPGVGAYGDCVRALQQCDGMIDALEEAALQRQTPFLGICVGMQMMLERGHEHGTHAGLGWIAGDVVKIERSTPDIRIPHMGWNELTLHHSHPLLRGITNGDHAYFVHSYHAACTQEGDVLASTTYGASIAAVIGRDNLVGTQFHPEKSQAIGAKVLENFLKMG